MAVNQTSLMEQYFKTASSQLTKLRVFLSIQNYFFTLFNFFHVLHLHANRTTNYQRIIPFCSLEKHLLTSFRPKTSKVLILSRCQAIILVVPDDSASFIPVSPGKTKKQLIAKTQGIVQ